MPVSICLDEYCIAVLITEICEVPPVVTGSYALAHDGPALDPAGALVTIPTGTWTSADLVEVTYDGCDYWALQTCNVVPNVDTGGNDGALLGTSHYSIRVGVDGNMISYRIVLDAETAAGFAADPATSVDMDPGAGEDRCILASVLDPFSGPPSLTTCDIVRGCINIVGGANVTVIQNPPGTWTISSSAGGGGASVEVLDFDWVDNLDGTITLTITEEDDGDGNPAVHAVTIPVGAGAPNYDIVAILCHSGTGNKIAVWVDEADTFQYAEYTGGVWVDWPVPPGDVNDLVNCFGNEVEQVVQPGGKTGLRLVGGTLIEGEAEAFATIGVATDYLEWSLIPATDPSGSRFYVVIADSGGNRQLVGVVTQDVLDAALLLKVGRGVGAWDLHVSPNSVDPASVQAVTVNDLWAVIPEP